jgi:3-oxoadipate enol-lactonase
MTAEQALRLTVDGPGEAPALVLGHSLGSSHIMWDDVVPLLTPHLRIIRYDLPGHGGSPVLRGEGPLTMRLLTGALMRALDAAGVGAFHLGGLSLGGLTALALAEAEPERVLTLSVMSSGPVNLPPEAWWDKAARVRREGTASLAEATMDRWFSPAFSRGAGRAWVRRIREEFLECDDEGYAQCCEVLAGADARPGLAALAMPTLLVSAQDDAGFDWAAADGLAARLQAGACPDVHVVRVPGARHMSAVEQPERIARALLARTGAGPLS